MKIDKTHFELNGYLVLPNIVPKSTLIKLNKNADQMMLDQVRGVLFLFIIISLFVGLFNLFPIPLLDGGHIMYFIIRRIFSNSLPEFITRVYLAVGITIISFLFIVVTYNDIFYK